ncbi:MAG: hypothetical protein V8R91_16300 [Butyricimonas faecihominis]
MGPDLQGGLLNRKLSWEKTDQYDLGLGRQFPELPPENDLGLLLPLHERQQLQQIDLPGDWNTETFQWQNALAVSNEGLEIELTADIFRETAVKWRMKLNVSKTGTVSRKVITDATFWETIIGKSLYNIRTYKTDGFYNSMDELQYYPQPHGFPTPLRTTIGSIFYPGTRKLVDMNNDGVIMKSLADQYYAASPLPLAHGGFINEIRWKQFDLNIFFTYSLGRHILKVYDDLSLQPNSAGDVITADVRNVNTWIGPDSKNVDYPRPMMYRVGNNTAATMIATSRR